LIVSIGFGLLVSQNWKSNNNNCKYNLHKAITQGATGTRSYPRSWTGYCVIWRENNNYKNNNNDDGNKSNNNGKEQ
jgi:hypothetical protein